jgi:hypothetical protein
MAPLRCMVRGALVQDEFSVVMYECDLGVSLLRPVVHGVRCCSCRVDTGGDGEADVLPRRVGSALSFASGLWLSTLGATQSTLYSPVEVPWEIRSNWRWNGFYVVEFRNPKHSVVLWICRVGLESCNGHSAEEVGQ